MRLHADLTSFTGLSGERIVEPGEVRPPGRRLQRRHPRDADACAQRSAPGRRLRAAPNRRRRDRGSPLVLQAMPRYHLAPPARRLRPPARGTSPRSGPRATGVRHPGLLRLRDPGPCRHRAGAVLGGADGPDPPPSTVYAAFNGYGGPKEIDFYPYNDPEGGEAFHRRRQISWLADGMPAGIPSKQTCKGR